MYIILHTYMHTPLHTRVCVSSTSRRNIVLKIPLLSVPKTRSYSPPFLYNYLLQFESDCSKGINETKYSKVFGNSAYNYHFPRKICQERNKVQQSNIYRSPRCPCCKQFIRNRKIP